MYGAIATAVVLLSVGVDSNKPPAPADGCRSGLNCSDDAVRHLTVGKYGESDCHTIQAAINCIPPLQLRAGNARVTVLVEPGVYAEQVVVNKSKISLVGQAPFIPYTYAKTGYCTSKVQLAWAVPNAAVLNVTSDDVVVSNFTVYNTANQYQVGKQFALYVDSGDRTAVYYSSFFGAQDTIYTGGKRIYFFGSAMNGTTDFNYGMGAAVYEECTIVGEPGEIYKGESFLTAASGANQSAHNSTEPTPHTPEARPSAYLIKNSRLPAVPNAKKTYLGRPWGKGATVIYDNVWMDGHIAAAGWYPWWTKCNSTDTTCADVFFAEFNSTGPGAGQGGRVKWSANITPQEAAQWSTERVLQGWTPPPSASVWAVNVDVRAHGA